MQDGARVHIGAPYDAAPLDVAVRSQDNANTRFTVPIELPYDPSLDQLVTLLVVGGTAFRQSGGGSSGQERSIISFQIHGRAAADAVARHFDVQPHLRRHPGHRLRIEFTTEPAPLVTADAAQATLHITNVGAEPICFVQGGRNRAERDNQFNFSATFRGSQVRDVGTSMHFGGLATRRTIAPGETFAQAVDLRKWFALDEPGFYEVLGSYAMEHCDPTDPSWHVLWEDYATASFTFEVVRPQAD
jgi:hypothetical protein